MNFQQKVFETTEDFRTRAAAFANSLKAPLAVLKSAGRDLNQVARTHASRFVKENRAIAVDASKEISQLARATYATLAKRPAAPVRKARKTAARKRTAAKAA